MPITPLPTAPSRSMLPATFITTMNAWIAALANFVTEANIVEAAVDADAATAAAAASAASASQIAAAASASTALAATTLVRRSTASLSISAGAKAITGMAAGATFVNTDQVTLIDATNDNNRMWGAVSAMNAGAGTMTVTVAAGAFAGSGTIANWIVVLSALAPGPTFNQYSSAKNFHTASAAIL